MNSDPIKAEIEKAFLDSVPFSVSITGEGELPSWFRVTDLAVLTMAAAGLTLARLMSASTGDRPEVIVDRCLASFWFRRSIRPQGWELPPVWDSIAGVYRTKDGWIRLHTNARHHREAALAVLGGVGERHAVAKAVSGWQGEALESAIIEAGGCAAALQSLEAWAEHPQGAAVASEPLVAWREEAISSKSMDHEGNTPLEGVRVLDLTRVLAGPICTRFLAGFGADVLRIDPPDWDEPAVTPETTLGKRRAGLDLNDRQDRQTFEELLAAADVLVHGYRPGALDGLGFDLAKRRALNPALIDVALNAYGWSGPWSKRRGFDSLVQMSSGLADFGMKQSGAEEPLALPVQALDHATGYLMAAAVLQGLAKRREGRASQARLSLARTAHLLSQAPNASANGGITTSTEQDLDPGCEHTAWGKARRLRFPMTIGGVTPHWRYPAGLLRTDQAVWLERSSPH